MSLYYNLHNKVHLKYKSINVIWGFKNLTFNKERLLYYYYDKPPKKALK